MLVLNRLSNSYSALAVTLAGVAAAGTGCGSAATSSPVEDMPYDDGGVAIYEGARDVVEVDCCDIRTSVQQALCDDLYAETEPEGLTIVDVCNAPDEGDADDECEGLAGLEALACGFGSALSTSPIFAQPVDPCDGLEGLERLLCQGSGAFGLGGQAQAPSDPLSQLLGGFGSLADVAGGLGALEDVLGAGSDASSEQDDTPQLF